MMIEKLRQRVPLFAFLLVGIAASTATAQSSRAFVAEKFQPAGGYADVLGIEGANVAPHLRFGAWAYINESHQIIRLINDANTNVQRNLLDNQVMVDVGGTLGLFDRLEIGLALPIAVYQSGQGAGDVDTSLTNGPSSSGLGDLRIVPKLQLVKGTGFNLGIGVPVSLPTGQSDTYLSFQSVTVTPQLNLEYDWDGGTRLLVNGGYSIRPSRKFVNTNVDSAVTYGAGIDIPVSEDWRILGAIQGQWITDESNSVGRPIEIQPAAQWLVAKDWGLIGGVGVGLTQGFGAPEWRVLLGAFWRPSQTPQDTDKDGVLDPNDICPEVHMGPHPDPSPARLGCPEADTDKDGVYDSQDTCIKEPAGEHPDATRLGCPEPDSDGDGIVDSKDACPKVPQGPNADPNRPGCPEPDTDGDGLVDSKDSCDKVPAGPRPDPAHPGCPMPDRDGDQVLDADDACPDVPGAPSRDPKKNGCPGLVQMKGAEIVTLKPIQFATGTAKILPSSFPILQGVLEVLLTHPDMALIAIEGHTDSKGNAKKNMTLSQQRADACKAWLVAHGTAAVRLDAKGYGPTKPIASNDTAAGRSQNRRVEFRSVTAPAPGEAAPEAAPAPAPTPEPAKKAPAKKAPAKKKAK